VAMDVGAAKTKATKSSLRGNAKNFILQAQKHEKSENTQKRYKSSLNTFVKFLDEQQQKQVYQEGHEQQNQQEGSDDEGDGDSSNGNSSFPFEEFFDIRRARESKDPTMAFFNPDYPVPHKLIYSFLHTAQYKQQKKPGKKKIKRNARKGIIDEVNHKEELISDSHLGNYNSAIVYLFKQKGWQMDDAVSAMMNLNRKSFKKIKVNTRLWMYPYF
jgi:hypothetical protein